MLEEARKRTDRFQSLLAAENIPAAILTDEASIAYFGGFWGYLSVEFGRPSFMVIPASGAPVVVTPLMESEMVSRMTWVEDIRGWEDFGDNSWANVLQQVLPGSGPVGVELHALPPIVRNWLDEVGLTPRCHDIGDLIGSLRRIKSPAEIDVMKQAGKIAGAMMQAAQDSLAEGAPEYESAIAVIAAGTRAAAGFLTDRGRDVFVSPVIHNLQIMQSGHDTSMVHRRASAKRLEDGDPVYFCFCNLAQFRQYKLGFDRMFHVSQISDAAREVQEAAIAAQQAAIAAIRPGVTAESVAEAANAIYQARGYETGYRTGRSIGMSHLEAPELKAGDQTLLEPGMTFAVDGGISVDGAFGGRIGDSVVVTETGCEYLTEYPREVIVV